MTHTRGHYKDFDNWANLTGDFSWSYENVVPLFNRVEQIDENKDTYLENSDFHQLGNAWVQAGESVGYNICDFNEFYQEGL